MSAEKELWDIYDADKNPTGETIDRYNFSLKPGQFHLAAIAVLITEDKKILITRRSMNKRWAAGLWEIPGGGVKAGENSEAAIYREILEETNIDLGDRKYEDFYTQKRESKESNSYFVDMYCFKISKKDILGVKVQEEEILESKIVSISELEDIAKRGEFLHFDNVKNFLYRCVG